jgi:hypothetical protein
MALIDRQYLAGPYYGSRRMAAWLTTQGHSVNRKRVQRLMQLIGLVAVYQRPNTSKSAPENKRSMLNLQRVVGGQASCNSFALPRQLKLISPWCWRAYRGAASPTFGVANVQIWTSY